MFSEFAEEKLNQATGRTRACRLKGHVNKKLGCQGFAGCGRHGLFYERVHRLDRGLEGLRRD